MDLEVFAARRQRPFLFSMGTGLGLTFCKLAIEAHRENIWVEQIQVLPGASFNFTLPIAD